MREAKERGTDIERCCEGLPMNLLMPDAGTRSDMFSSSSNSREAGTSVAGSPSTNIGSLRAPPSSAVEGHDNPPRELLTEAAVDGVDPPVPTNLYKIGTSHGELPKLNKSKDIEGFVAGQVKSPDHPQVPCDEPLRTSCGPAEREVLKAYYKEPASVILNYFNILVQVVDPATPAAGWPNSLLMPGHSPIAATLISAQMNKSGVDVKV